MTTTWSSVPVVDGSMPAVALTVLDEQVFGLRSVPIERAVVSDGGLVLTLFGNRHASSRLAWVQADELSDSSAVRLVACAGWPEWMRHGDWLLQDVSERWVYAIQLDQPLGNRQLLTRAEAQP